MISRNEYEMLPQSERKYIDLQGDKILLVGDPERFVNHSCDPNTTPGDLCDIARRDIVAGEEITADYALFCNPDGGFECRCGKENCRGKIKAFNDTN